VSEYFRLEQSCLRVLDADLDMDVERALIWDHELPRDVTNPPPIQHLVRVSTDSWTTKDRRSSYSIVQYIQRYMDPSSQVTPFSARGLNLLLCLQNNWSCQSKARCRSGVLGALDGPVLSRVRLGAQHQQVEYRHEGRTPWSILALSSRNFILCLHVSHHYQWALT
jgi:hypothetical protein